MTITHLVTHSGGFHADELLSSVILMRLFPDATLVRSRDEAWITAAHDKIIYDVGRLFDADAQIFDHHQRPNPLRPDGQPYSSFGLVWAHYGRDYLRATNVPEADIEDIYASFDAGFVLPVDLVDNGALAPASAGLLGSLSLPVLLETLKPVFDNRSADGDDAAFAAAGTDRVLELPMGMPFRAAIDNAGADHLLFVVHPRDTDWAITGIRISGDGFEQRADLPAAWAGLTDGDLEQASGVAGAKFCHNGRFIAVAATRAAALEMAALAVRETEAAASR
jgi:uncharacterized UPF0160 family protein